MLNVDERIDMYCANHLLLLAAPHDEITIINFNDKETEFKDAFCMDFDTNSNEFGKK